MLLDYTTDKEVFHFALSIVVEARHDKMRLFHSISGPELKISVQKMCLSVVDQNDTSMYDDFKTLLEHVLEGTVMLVFTDTSPRGRDVDSIIGLTGKRIKMTVLKIPSSTLM